MKKMKENFYINTVALAAIFYANNSYTGYFEDGTEITIDTQTFQAISPYIESYKVNDLLYINPDHILGLASVDEEYIITFKNGIRLNVLADDFEKISQMEPSQGGSAPAAMVTAVVYVSEDYPMSLTFYCDDTSISTFEELYNWLKNKGFTNRMTTLQAAGWTNDGQRVVAIYADENTICYHTPTSSDLSMRQEDFTITFLGN